MKTTMTLLKESQDILNNGLGIHIRLSQMGSDNSKEIVYFINSRICVVFVHSEHLEGNLFSLNIVFHKTSKKKHD